MKKDNINYRRASDSDSEAIKNILRETFNEYEMPLQTIIHFPMSKKLKKITLN